MVSPEDSLVSPVKSSPLRPMLIVTAVVGLAGLGWWMFGRGKGQPEDPARVLIVGPTPELAEYLEHKGFDADHLSFGAAVGLDPEREHEDLEIPVRAPTLVTDRRGPGRVSAGWRDLEVVGRRWQPAGERLGPHGRSPASAALSSSNSVAKAFCQAGPLAGRLAWISSGQAPVQLTDNDRRDLDPTFAGPDGRLLLFHSEYQADEKLPAIDTLRAIAIP